ncbi:hypothetical protein K0651_01995 [Ornithinimicrobium sp. Arc0846-15]|nr:hypothetical protein [Ornithinimicrobium laminariae]
MKDLTLNTVTAVECGQRADGSPIPRRTYELVRPPEDFGHTTSSGSKEFARSRSRLWGKCAMSARHGLDRIAPIGVVYTDSIEQALADELAAKRVSS